MLYFDHAFEAIIRAEGGYVNDPQDPGGETKYGISKRQYPLLDIPSLTLTEARVIYHRDYWTPIKGIELPWPMAALILDTAINQGVDVAKRLTQKALGVTQDGLFGPITLQALNTQSSNELAARFLADRALRYTGTRNFDHYGRGWFKRLFALTMEVSR